MRNWAFAGLLALAACSGSGGGTATAAPLSFAITPFTAAPGSQGLKCQTFANPLGRDVEVSAWAAHLKAGGHHMTVYLVKGEPEAPLHDCGGNEAITKGGGLIFQGQQAGDSELVYPDGLTAVVPAGYAISVEVHYVNAGAQELTIENVLEARTAAAPTRAHVGPFNVNNMDIHVPPHQNGSAQRKCTFDRDVDLVWLTSHMHTHGVEFEAKIGDSVLFDNKLWDGPPVHVFSPAMTVRAGQPLAYSCSYVNDTDHELTFGISLYDYEMCILPGGYVSTDAVPAPLVCNEDAAPPPGSCLTCSQALVANRPSDACANDGPPSSAAKVEQLQGCTCKTTCAEACGDNRCAGKPASDACTQCTAASCAAEQAACFQ